VYSVYDVLRAADYVALKRISGDDAITGMPCPVVDHKNQSAQYGPATVYPPKSGGESFDPGSVVCHNCGESWGAAGLAKCLAVEKNVKKGKAPPKMKLEAKSAPEPVDLRVIWEKSHASAQDEIACKEYLIRRWGDEEFASQALKYVGWTASLKQNYFSRNYYLFVPAWDKDGELVTGIRRYVGFGNVDKKSKRLPNSAVGLDKGTQIWIGDNPTEVGDKCGGSNLWICEGEIDTLLMLAMRDAGIITGSVIGAPGSCANSQSWWSETAGFLQKPWPMTVILAMDSDEQGDKYVQKASGFFPSATRIPMPEGQDLTDIISNGDRRELISLANAAKNVGNKFYVMDNGTYSYNLNDTWYVCKRQSAIKARVIESGMAPEEAAATVSMLPPAADIVFDPSDANPVVFRDGNTYLNTWKGLPIAPSEGKWDLIHELLFRLCGRSQVTVDYVLDWLAHPFQALKRGKVGRCRTALIFYGSQGTGKGFFFDQLMRHLYGQYHTILNHRNLEDKFDPAKISSSLFVVANEVADSTMRDAKTLNILKAWITDSNVSVRRMNQAAMDSPIHFNMVMTSNHAHPIRLEPTDRRYTLIRCDEILYRDKEFMKRLVLERDSGWPTAAHFMHSLRERSILNDVGVPLDTKWREDLLEAGRPSQEAFAIAMCEVGFNSIAEDWRCEMDRRGRNGPFWRVKDGFAPSSTLSEVYSYWCGQQGVRHPVRAHELIEAVQRECEERGIELIPKQRQIGNRKMRGFLGLPMFEPDSYKTTQQRAEAALDRINLADMEVV
tara:strand:+ start:1401 stop:3743 length:2343 start_codon:yes stop_codon:yes gene_type:complete